MAKREKASSVWWAVATRRDDGAWFPWFETLASTPGTARVLYKLEYGKKFADVYPNPCKSGVDIRRFSITEIPPKPKSKRRAKR